MTQTNKQHGFTLIEVLITMVIMAIGLLGLAGLQVVSLRNTEVAYQRSQATSLAYDMLDRMRSNPKAVEDGRYNAITTAPGSYTDCTAGSCTTDEMAAFDNGEWHNEIAAVLPSGTGTVSGSGSGSVFTITISWDEDRDPATALSSFSLSSRVL